MESSNENKVDITMAELIETGVLRSVAGFGLGLLLAGMFSDKARRRTGGMLFLSSIAFGAPIGAKLFKKNKGLLCK